jgi:hypothetical protein
VSGARQPTLAELLMNVQTPPGLSGVPLASMLPREGPADVSEAPPAPPDQQGIAEIMGQPFPPELAAAMAEHQRRLDAMPKPDMNLSRPPENDYLAPNNRPWRDDPRYMPEQIPLGSSAYTPFRGGRT